MFNTFKLTLSDDNICVVDETIVGKSGILALNEQFCFRNWGMNKNILSTKDLSQEHIVMN